MSNSGSDLCYKSCGDYVVSMKKLADTICNESRKGIVDPLHAKFRADKLLVISIQHKFSGKIIDRIQNTSYHKQIWYVVSEVVSVLDYCLNLEEVCAQGIHYYLSKDPAFYWGNRQLHGLKIFWHDNGQKYEECNYVDGKIHGVYRSWWLNGNKHEERIHETGQLYGPYQSWYDNGQKHEKSSYVQGKLDGSYQSWYDNGQKRMECSYIIGELDGPFQTWYSNGLKHKKCFYTTGKLNGPYLYWHSYGELINEDTYVYGIRSIS